MAANKFLVKNPIITEKTTTLSELGKYVFLVSKDSTAPEIKKAVESIYKVKVTKVNIVNGKDKPKQWFRGSRMIGKKSGQKKAIITLKAGQKLDVLPH